MGYVDRDMKLQSSLSYSLYVFNFRKLPICLILNSWEVENSTTMKLQR